MYLSQNGVRMDLCQQQSYCLCYGRFVRQTKEFIKKTGVDKILLTEDKEEGKEDFLTCGAFGRTECVIAALDLMKDEAGCRKSLVGIVLFNWNDRNVEIL